MCEIVKVRIVEVESNWNFECLKEPIRIIDDVVSIQCLSIDWLKRRDVMPSKVGVTSAIEFPEINNQIRSVYS